jgi:hypothetical protein
VATAAVGLSVAAAAASERHEARDEGQRQAPSGHLFSLVNACRSSTLFGAAQARSAANTVSAARSGAPETRAAQGSRLKVLVELS